MDTYSPTPGMLATRRADAMARSFTIDSVRGRLAEANRFLDVGERFIQQGMFAKVDPKFLLDTANSLHDAMGDLVGGMQRDLENAGGDSDGCAVDLSDLNALIARLIKESA